MIKLFIAAFILCLSVLLNAKTPPPPPDLNIGQMHFSSDSFSIRIEETVKGELYAFKRIKKIDIGLESRYASLRVNVISLGSRNTRTSDSEKYKRAKLPESLISELRDFVSENTLGGGETIQHEDAKKVYGDCISYELAVGGKRSFVVSSYPLENAKDMAFLTKLESSLNEVFESESLLEESTKTDYVEGDYAVAKQSTLEGLILHAPRYKGKQVRVLGRFNSRSMIKGEADVLTSDVTNLKNLGNVKVTDWSLYAKGGSMLGYDGAMVWVTGLFRATDGYSELYLENITGIELADE
ncbi:hypothetical protein MLD52_22680 [Puniceicoccaceae bacterium K14]|nr:hypothetical protein [Puniceicoccaceae bacterium K14]